MKQILKYGHLLPKESKAIPWDRFSVNLIGPYKIIRLGQDEPLILKYLTMTDHSIGWFIIVRNNDKYAATIENLVEQKLLYTCPRLAIIKYDYVNEFLGHAL